MVKVGMAWYSICTMSGAPLPAFSAVRSLVYWGVPWPALTTLTLTAGYFFSKSATSSPMFGTHVQNVSSVGVFMALSMSARPTGLVDADEPPESLPPQAVRAAPSDTAPVAPRNSRRFIGERPDIRSPSRVRDASVTPGLGRCGEAVVFGHAGAGDPSRAGDRRTGSAL